MSGDASSAGAGDGPAHFARAEAWLAPRRRRVLLALLGLAIFVRLIVCLQVAPGPLPQLHQLLPDSDNRFFHDWAMHLAQGDWLQRAPLHPMTNWMRQVAESALAQEPELPRRLGLAAPADHAALIEQLWAHWYGGSAFHQEPAYAYLVALTYRIAGPGVWGVFVWQLLLGVAAVALVVLLARRLGGELAGLVGGLMAVLYPIPLMYELTLLRESLIVFTTLALAWAMYWAGEGGRRRWLVLGLLVGAAALVKSTFLLFVPLLVLWRLAAHRAPMKERLVPAALFCAGLVGALLPLLARDLAVGVPGLELNGSAGVMLLLYHAAGAHLGSAPPYAEFVRILLHSDARGFDSLADIVRGYPSLWELARLEVAKLAYAFHSFERPDNVDFYVFRQGAPVLRWLPLPFTAIVPLAAIGALSRRWSGAGPLLVAALAQLPSFVIVEPLARFRAPMAAALLPIAALGALRVAGWIRRRRAAALIVAAVGTAAYLAWALAPLPDSGESHAQRCTRVGEWALAIDQPYFAEMNFRQAIAEQPDPRSQAGLVRALSLQATSGGGR